MAEEELKIPEIVEEIPAGVAIRKEVDESTWRPKTELGRKVKSKDITSIEQLLQHDKRFLEAEIIDFLIKDIQSDLLNIGQSKGKFGGGKRSIWRQTQKKTREGNKPKFAALAAVGNRDGYIGIGHGKAKETMPAREKAIRAAKLNIISIKRGCGAWDCACANPHSIPFKVSGKCGSARIILIPAARGTGLCVEKECRKILALVGIKDVYAKTFNSKTKLNLIYACFNALKQLSTTKTQEQYKKSLGIIMGTGKNE
ncbi:MAG TPA: 30S ribosomal protein S5 [Candidatus Nanoarchaeia archaeon]|nr:30S ribosomal protein S5 [Candidatus Nanoarchaeia archaeon]